VKATDLLKELTKLFGGEYRFIKQWCKLMDCCLGTPEHHIYTNGGKSRPTGLHPFCWATRPHRHTERTA